MGLAPVELVWGTGGGRDAEVDVYVTAADGRRWRIPCFRTGAGEYRFRFAPPQPGRYTWTTEATARTGGDAKGVFDVAGESATPFLFRRGRLKVADGGRTLQHEDGTPFLWLADTWWAAFTRRLPWPDEFARLTQDRVRKGFTVIQVVAGPLPDYDAPSQAFDPAQAGEAGCPWQPGWEAINEAYFDRVDAAVRHLLDNGLVPCIVGMWGYWALTMGEERVRRHWRNLVARYAAWPVVWCLAGETTMATYGTIFRGDESAIAAESAQQRALWSRMAVWLREADPWHNPVTTHPRAPGASSGDLEPGVPLDLEMVQTTHMGYSGLHAHLETLGKTLASSPHLPVFVAEANYEGIMGSSWADIQRFQFWTSMTMGCCGHTYGAQGIWGMNSRRDPYRGFTGDWGRGYWEDAMHYPGSMQLGVGAQVLARYPWYRCRPFEERAAIALGRPWSFTTGIPGELAIYYLPANTNDPRHLGCVAAGWMGNCLPIRLPAGTPFDARFVDPITGRDLPIGVAKPDPAGSWTPPRKPSSEDWILVLERVPRPPRRPAPGG